MPKRTLEHGAGLLAGIVTLGSTGINCSNLIIPPALEEQVVTKAKKGTWLRNAKKVGTAFNKGCIQLVLTVQVCTMCPRLLYILVLPKKKYS